MVRTRASGRGARLFFLELTLNNLVRHRAGVSHTLSLRLEPGRGTKGAEAGPRRLGGLAEGQSFWAAAWLSAKAFLWNLERSFASHSQHNPNPTDHLFLCRVQIHNPRAPSLFSASPTFAPTGSCVATWCWSQMPRRLSR